MRLFPPNPNQDALDAFLCILTYALTAFVIATFWLILIWLFLMKQL